MPKYILVRFLSFHCKSTTLLQLLLSFWSAVQPLKQKNIGGILNAVVSLIQNEMFITSYLYKQPGFIQRRRLRKSICFMQKRLRGPPLQFCFTSNKLMSYCMIHIQVKTSPDWKTAISTISRHLQWQLVTALKGQVRKSAMPVDTLMSRKSSVMTVNFNKVALFVDPNHCCWVFYSRIVCRHKSLLLSLR